MKYNLILNYCCWNQTEHVTRLLKQNDDIDIMYQSGVYFKEAIKNNNTDMLNALLQYDNYRLINASTAGEFIKVKALLAEGKVDIDFQESLFGNTALHFASQQSHKNVIKLLIENGANQEITNNRGCTPQKAYAKGENLDHEFQKLADEVVEVKDYRDSSTKAYQIHRQKLQEILQDAVDTYEISQEIQNVLNPYLPTEDSDSEQQLDDIEINSKIEEYHLQKSINNLIFDKEKICEAFYDLCCSGSKESISVFAKNFQLSLDMSYKNGCFLTVAANNDNEAALEFFYETFPAIYNKYYSNLVSTVASSPSTECQVFLDSHHAEIETSGNIDQLYDNL